MDQVRVLRVVIASPGDVKAEREIIPRVVDEVNRNIARPRGLHLEVYRWETDSYPGFHPQGPQGLIDPILKIEECDILIGIFWRRFGTPVSDAKSGTEHEFRLAFEAWKKNGKPQIMVYFSQKPYTPKSKEETDQWGLLLQFKKDFPREGLWWDYKSRAEFEQLTRNHLTNFMSTRFLIEKPSPQPATLTPLHQLPPPPADFTGRTAELAELRSAIEKGGVHISGLQGQGGVGKTALALKLAAELAPSYPDAQIYLDLKGVSEKPLTVAEAMSHVLRTFHPQAKLPETVEELSPLYYSTLHGKRALLLMDNAKDAAQVQPLTPQEGCTLLVTSRNRFYLPGTAWKTLETLPPSDAQRLLLRIAPRAQGEAGAIAELCGYLPLVLHLAAKVIAERPDLSATAYRERLAYEGAPFVGSAGEIEVSSHLRLELELLDPRVRALATLRGQSEGSRARLQIFLCHSSADKPAVRSLYHRLQHDGFAPWLDEEQLIGGQDWEYEIQRAVRRSDIVVVCLSRSSTSKAGFVQKEIKYALDIADEQPQGMTYIIPLKLEECDVPERLARWQWINYFEDGGHRKLERALDARAAGTGQGKRAGRAAELPELRDAIQEKGSFIYRPAQEILASRPQLLIVRWGQIDEATFTAHNKAPHIVQHGFFIRNFGLGETAIGVRVRLTVPTEVPDAWTNGEGSTPTIVIGKDQEVFVPLWRKLGGYLIGHVLSRFDLRHFLVQTYNGRLGNQEIPVTITYGSNGNNYATTQSLIFSPEQRDIVGFGVPEQRLEQSAQIEAPPSKGSLVPNLVLKRIHTGGLIFTGNECRQFELPGKGPVSDRLLAIWAELKNDSSESRRVGPISGVKAELVVTRESGGEKLSPLVWLDNEFNAVNFELADTHHVLLVANMNSSMAPTSDWVVPLNHRARSGSRGSSLRIEVSHGMEQENADIRLNLLHTETGTVLQSFAGKYIWREGRSGPSITLQPQ